MRQARRGRWSASDNLASQLRSSRFPCSAAFRRRFRFRIRKPCASAARSGRTNAAEPWPVSPPGTQEKTLLRSASDTSSGTRPECADRLRKAFPRFVRYVERRGAKLPEQLLGRKDGACPWNSRAEFLAAESSQRMKQLRKFLADTIDLQADFLVERLQDALPKMLAAAPPEARGQIAEQFERRREQRAGLLRADRLRELQG